MRFIHADSPEIVRDAIVQPIVERLRKQRPVLLLVSGGSTAGMAVAAITMLVQRSVEHRFDTRRLLSVSLIDERFGPVGHRHSNWQQLLQAGLPVASVRALPLLLDSRDDREALDAAVARFDALLTDAARSQADGQLLIVGLLGIGADGHTAGILPGSPACSEDGDRPGAALAIGYKAEAHTRITITPAFFQYFDRVLAYAAGPEKWPALARLGQTLPICDHPAQLLKRPAESLVYSDMVPGESAEFGS